MRRNKMHVSSIQTQIDKQSGILRRPRVTLIKIYTNSLQLINLAKNSRYMDLKRI